MKLVVASSVGSITGICSTRAVHHARMGLSATNATSNIQNVVSGQSKGPEAQDAVRGAHRRSRRSGRRRWQMMQMALVSTASNLTISLVTLLRISARLSELESRNPSVARSLGEIDFTINNGHA